MIRLAMPKCGSNLVAALRVRTGESAFHWYWEAQLSKTPLMFRPSLIGACPVRM